MTRGDFSLGGTAVDRRTVLQSVGAAGLLGTGVGTAWAQTPTVESAPTARGSINQVLVTEVVPGATVTLYGPSGDVADEAQARYPEEPEDWFDAASYVFRSVDPGEGYEVTQTVNGQESPRSDPVEVFSEDYVPPQSFYDDQDLGETADGEIGYVEMRDGTTLAHQTVFPPESVAEPPYPTLFIYSGYAPSVDLPGSEVIVDQIVEEMGYAIVAVNMRGTQCSGGKFDFFETLQILDGYDVVEAVGAQDWAAGIGMVGGSYSGYSQFYVAATQPPSLDAISPGMPAGDFYRDVGYPGGLLNTTFAALWAGSRDQAARHDTDGRGDTTERVQQDPTCMANQSLRPNNRPTLARMQDNPTIADFYRERSPWYLADQIEVPVLLNVAWQDEQVGSRATRIQEQIPDETTVRFVAGNGDHNIYLSPPVVEELLRFNSYYVREEIADADAGEFDSYEAALSAYENEDPVRVLGEMDQEQEPRFEATYADWPPADETWELYLQPGGTLAEDPPETTDPAVSTYRFRSEPTLTQPLGRDEGRLVWEPDDEAASTAFVSEELAEDRVLLGSGFVELWLGSTAADTDLQITLTEVRPDGTEMFVQNGWLRASHRQEDPDLAKERRPWHTHLAADQQPLPTTGFANLRVELHPFGHVFRAGSRLKIAVDNPGGTRPLWGFEVLDEEATNVVAHTAAMPSKVALPLISDETAQTADRPACGTVRNQPCRPVDVEAITGREGPAGVFGVADLDPASGEATAGEVVEVGATVRNVVEGGEDTEASVELLLDGEVAQTSDVSIGGGDSETVTVELETGDLDPGEYSHSIRTGDDAVAGTLTISAGQPDDGDDDDTGDPGDDDDGTSDPDDGDDSTDDGGDGSGGDGAEESADDGGPGFGVPAALASLGGVGYLLRRRLGGEEQSRER